MRITLLYIMILSSWGILSAQTTGTLGGNVVDGSLNEEMPYAQIALEKEGSQIANTLSDLNGAYFFKDLEVGTYTILVASMGYPNLIITDVQVRAGEDKRLDLVFPENTGVGVDTLIVEAKEPIVRQDITTTKMTLTGDDLLVLPTTNLEDVAKLKAGVIAKDDGEAISSLGGRTGANLVVVDGQITSAANVQMEEVAQIEVMTSGIPVNFGDATGAITNIITKGPSSRLSINGNAESSQFLDNFGVNRAGLSLSGPMLRTAVLDMNGEAIKDADGNIKKRTLLGYRISGNYYTTLDSRPSALGSYKLKDEVFNRLQAQPLIPSLNNEGVTLASDYLTADDFEETNVRQNMRQSRSRFNAKVEYKPSLSLFVVAGMNGEYEWGKTGSTRNLLMNHNFNNDFRRSNINTFARVRHTVLSTQIEDMEEDSSLNMAKVFQNLSYEFQIDYAQNNYHQEDPRHADRLWNYGYVGKFYRERIPVIQEEEVFVKNSAGEIIGSRLESRHIAFNERFTGFDLNYDINPGLAAYNSHINQPVFNDFGPIVGMGPTTLNEMEIINGAVLGNRSSAYNLYNSPHLTNSQYFKSNSQQIRARLDVNFDLVSNVGKSNAIRHSILMGGVYEQRFIRRYSISDPSKLWTLADQRVNRHIANSANASAPTGEQYYDPITKRYYDIYEADIVVDESTGGEVQMTEFARNLRNQQGLLAKDWVNVHELTPDQMQMQWFEPTALISGADRMMSYYGYDYLGNQLPATTSFNDFFYKEENGVKTRPVAAFNPTYISGYIQDKFRYKDFICRVGFRFDSYDANTKVLKDPYSVVGTYNAAEFEGNSGYNAAQNAGYNRPSNIEDNYAVYVSENSQDATVVGYRSDDQWYDANGIPVNTPSELGSTIVPALRGFSSSEVDTKGENYDVNAAFEDYQSKVVIMPRISFSFPINDKANFYANYDILSRRPEQGLSAASALTYFNFRELATGSGAERYLPNANLNPQKTINYEVGYEQALTDFSRFKLSMLYREERDMIQIRKYVYAYPVTYETYGNDDFATIKSFLAEYEIRANKNLRLLANYTLQFAEGTGSSPASSLAVSAEDIKNIFALDMDQRHSFTLMMDYRYGKGKKYNGPMIGKVKLLENTGLNVVAIANSGTPYTAKKIAGGIGTSFSDQLTEGSINGARMPWNIKVDMRLDRNFVIGKENNAMRMNIYLRIQNLFNTQNIMNVYAATGAATNDGFLNTDAGEAFERAQAESYAVLYNLRMNNPYNISRPRRIFLGMRFSL